MLFCSNWPIAFISCECDVSLLARRSGEHATQSREGVFQLMEPSSIEQGKGGRSDVPLPAPRIGAIVRPTERDREEVGAGPADSRGASRPGWLARAHANAARRPLDLAR